MTRPLRLAAVIVALAFILACGAARAEEPAKSGPLSTVGRMRDALKRLPAGQEVELVLAGGKSYRGRLASVGDETVLLSELAGKEFYDALVRIEDVAAIELRARGR